MFLRSQAREVLCEKYRADIWGQLLKRPYIYRDFFISVYNRHYRKEIRQLSKIHMLQVFKNKFKSLTHRVFWHYRFFQLQRRSQKRFVKRFLKFRYRLMLYSRIFKGKLKHLNIHRKRWQIRDEVPIRIDIQKPTPIYKRLSAFGKKLVLKQRLKLFHILKEKKLLKLIRLARIQDKTLPKLPRLLRLLCLRLEVVLVQTYFFTSILASRQFIQKGYVMVNNYICLNPDHFLSKGDRITFTAEALKVLESTLEKKLPHSFRLFPAKRIKGKKQKAFFKKSYQKHNVFFWQKPRLHFQIPKYLELFPLRTTIHIIGYPSPSTVGYTFPVDWSRVQSIR